MVVWRVGVAVLHPLVSVPVHMRLAGGIAGFMRVLVMGVMHMYVLVRHRLMQMFMLVRFGQVNDDA